MARDGSGNYSLPAGQPAVTGTTISASTFNTAMSDVAAALTASIAKDGQTTPTADLPMGTHKHTGVGDGSARTHYPSIGQIQDGGLRLAGSVGGTANAITASLTPAITTYVTGMMVTLIPASDNTANTTLALNGLAAKNITDLSGTSVAGLLKANTPVVLVYSGTAFILAGTSSQSGSFTGTLSGCTTSPTLSILWRRTGHLVSMTANTAVSGTSNSTSMEISGIPTALQPATYVEQALNTGITDNGVVRGAGLVGIYPTYNAAVLRFAISATFSAQPSTTGFTSSGTKGVNSLSFHYSLY